MKRFNTSFESSKLYVAALLPATTASDRTLTLFSPPFGPSQTSIKVPTPLGVRLRPKTKVVDTVSAPVSVWLLEWDISVPINTSVPFRIYRKYIYIYN